MRFGPIRIIFPLLLCVGNLSCTDYKESVQPPNIIYIFADDLGYGELGSYGQQKIKTPNLDRLAQQGIRFTQHYTGAPVCAPSRYILLTGKHSGHAYIRGNYELGGFEDTTEGGQMPIPKGTPTLGTLLKEQGYATAIIGKWGLGMYDTTGNPQNHGFDYAYGYLDQKQAHNYYPTHLWENGVWDSLPNPYFSVHKSIPQGAKQEIFDAFKGNSYAPDKMASKALNFIDKHAGETPFFLYYPSPIPHLALQVPDSLLAAYKDKFDEKPYHGEDGYSPHQYPLSAYAAMITHLDRQVGLIWDKVIAKGEEENTIIFFSSDNGPTFLGGVSATYFGSTGGLRGLKMDVYEGGIRVPFIAYWKNKIKPGRVSEFVSGQWDMFNTFSDLVGSSKRSSDGISLVPELFENPQQAHPYLYFEYPEKQGQLAIRVGDWKGVKTGLKTNVFTPWQLYHLKNDPSESIDRAQDFPEKIKSLDSIVRLAHQHPHIREWEIIDSKLITH